MTIRRTYSCDLCRDELFVQAEPYKKTGRGVQFSGKSIKFVDLHSAETHLCSQCIEAIVAAHTDDRCF